MVLQFQPILGMGSRASNPLKRSRDGSGGAGVNLQGHSFTTRFLAGVMTKQTYKSNPEHFDMFLKVVFEDLESLYYNGISVRDDCTLRFLVLGLKGDLPFLTKAGHLNRTFMNIRKGPAGPNSKPLTGCCWMCAAGSSAVPFEEFTRSPAWLQTVGPNNELPWATIPDFMEHVPHVLEDKGSFFKLDLLHVYHLGIGRDFAASSLVVALNLIYQGAIPDRLASMNRHLKQYLKESRKQVHFKLLTRDLLGYNSERSFPAGHWNKAFDTPVLIEFVGWLVRQDIAIFRSERRLRIIASACDAMSRFMRSLLRAGLWMQKQQAAECGEDGLHFLLCYNKLAIISFNAGQCRYNMVPKLHCFHHLCLDLLHKSVYLTFLLNPLSQCTFQDEDFVGRVSRLSRRVSPRLQCLRTIQRYLVATRYELPSGK